MYFHQDRQSFKNNENGTFTKTSIGHYESSIEPNITTIPANSEEIRNIEQTLLRNPIFGMTGPIDTRYGPFDSRD